VSPCNCGKRREPRPRTGTSAQAKSQAPKSPKPASGKTQSFALTTHTGKTQTFGSRLEAEAENARNGYTGRVTPQ
jgi:hypothetical protein